jgi:hypothetical protein
MYSIILILLGNKNPLCFWMPINLRSFIIIIVDEVVWERGVNRVSKKFNFFCMFWIVLMC